MNGFSEECHQTLRRHSLVYTFLSKFIVYYFHFIDNTVLFQNWQFYQKFVSKKNLIKSYFSHCTLFFSIFPILLFPIDSWSYVLSYGILFQEQSKAQPCLCGINQDATVQILYGLTEGLSDVVIVSHSNISSLLNET